MRIHLTALGCRLNEAELESWAQRFQARGWRIAPSAAEADLVVMNTCAVTAEATRKSRKAVNRLHRENPRARLVLTGCSATLDPEQAARSLGVDLVVTNPDKDRLVEIATERLDLPVAQSPRTSDELALFARGRQRAFVKVQDGCRYRCTFCIVTVARGEERSRPIAEVVAEVEHIVASGVREVVLTGVHIGGYGSDIGSDLQALIEAVLERTGVCRLRLGSVEPWDLPESFFELFDDPRFMPHLHLPLQSGSDSVLRRMARRCKTDSFERLVERARSRVTDLNVTTDIIVGFPGETDAEWSQTLGFVERMGFGRLHIFAYSARPGTKAARLPDHVPEPLRRERSRELHALGKTLEGDTLERHAGLMVPVLLETRPEEGTAETAQYFGYTPNYLRVAMPARVGLEGSVQPVRLLGVNDARNALIGEVHDGAPTGACARQAGRPG